jgi:hypothetical protein
MFGIDWSDPQTFWLNMTNAGLGLIVLACVLLIGYGVLRDVIPKYFRRRVPAVDDHGTWVSDLGWTVADGGEKLDRKPKRTDDTRGPF